MKKNVLKIGFAALLGLFLSNSLSAQEREKVRLSVGPEVTLPVGSFSDAFDWSIGGSIQADYAIYKNDLYVTLNAGYNNYFAKDFAGVSFNDLQLIPVKAGLKYFVAKNFYVHGEAGASFVANKSDVGATKSTAFVYAPQIGYLFPVGGKNYIDAGVRFEGTTKFTDQGSSNNVLGLRVAYSFGL
ncbi:outer membrane beta-barrel protein [Sphingobacterium corticibacter]|uniref:Outer membrane protein beta-barrel domain-containing protein n=1 Tax=Sphingobacterium corticibacter TaxID=2171749 RepID=A0A2T8HM22_9SPHI|nr:outer membrane beta-barrel protein [Sphingobacterium corticibacter]PVH26477.1 hypothetical protein DC487_02330 [Sphingobacterium corticibacter]